MVYRHADRLVRIRTLAALAQRHPMTPGCAAMLREIELLASGLNPRRERRGRSVLEQAAEAAMHETLACMDMGRWEQAASSASRGALVAARVHQQEEDESTRASRPAVGGSVTSTEGDAKRSCAAQPAERR
jgi:hypothetical protein